MAVPLEKVGVVEAPDGHAGSLDPVALAEVCAFLPAVGRTGRRVIKEKEECVAQGEGPAFGIPGMPQPMIERIQPRDSPRRGAPRNGVGVGGRVRVGAVHRLPFYGNPAETR
jgi:hypothetical protein